ncbi:F0F1 ATP synthase subunit delta [Acetivibrio thermocellus]|uniref:ATP synthase subunit delta n=2 Tax=Acetivibrio thermocellus TaxID=1515 RepID=ATPD_ACET2|nr:F0F1 ATP synthase subunit delta [Acetivibrio thermocellus]A3DIM6.2 RecName: Full=ATP synthase subunit delta; AltName: Full=ATP synthase F(1) sector subunit delta; AltName: Full=F-type ATPase subunit delta; Short=F-ATPase subunit delta [Acetivibrio thermocellus ATCC 27405]UWV47124.1 F0F1 ATP synthase subunit delta [Acetivibrio thermocellus]HOP92744.1 F0F1 ATP synthase subunit delta [Acetivibrio thermocellus]
MQLVNTRYAEALIDVTEEKNSTDKVLNNLVQVLKLLEENREFYSFLLDPQIQKESRKEAIIKVFEGRIEQEVVNFLMLLVDKERFENIRGIVEEYFRLADERKNILNMTIISAFPLEDVQINRIKEKYKKLYNKTDVKAKLIIDKSLIGGVKIQIGDKVIDDSIKGRLLCLKEALLQR